VVTTEVKTFEIRDEGTFIPVLCVRGIVAEIPEPDHYLVWRAGWTNQQTFVYLTTMNDCRTQYDPFQWGGCRTMTNAHRYIREHWDELPTGSVVDVEYILGESESLKASERHIPLLTLDTQQA